MLTGASPFSDFVDTTFLLIAGASALVLLGLLVAMITFVVRYSRKRNPQATNIEGNTALEIAWTVIPLVLFMGMFYLGWEGYSRMSNVPANAIPIQVTARMWAWSFQYPNGLQTDTLFVPTGRPVKLTLRSLDVNHSMYIPAFRIKKDAIPNRENVMWFSTDEARAYDVACAEYCGLRHAYMYTKVVGMAPGAFEQWFRTASEKASRPYAPLTAESTEKE
jgi:cytochrome c oxidase subunit II